MEVEEENVIFGGYDVQDDGGMRWRLVIGVK